MHRTHRALRWATALILLLQVAIGSVSLSAMVPAGDHGGDVVCTCFHGAEGHAMCPMHHTASGQARCRVRGMDDQATVALATLLAPLAPQSAAPAGLAAPASAAVAPAGFLPPVHPSVAPDLPPPRS